MLPKWYPNKFEALDGNYIENHCIAISRRQKIAVLFVHSDPDSTRKMELQETIEHGFLVVRVYFKKAQSGLGWWDDIMTALRYARAQRLGYKAILEKMGAPRLIHVHVLTRTGALALRLWWTRRIPYLVSEHWSGYYPERGIYRGWIKKISARIMVANARAITTVSQSLQKAMQYRSLGGQYYTIPNVFDEQIFVPRQLEGLPQRKKILHVSTLDSPIKRFDRILHGLDRLAGQRDDFDIVVLGDGPEKAAQEKLASTLSHLNHRIVFHGDVDKTEVARHMREAAFIVLYSTLETQSVVLLEALASGTPFVATRVGGIPEHYEDYGILIEKDDENALVQAMNTMLDQFNTYSPEKLNAHARANFSDDQVSQQFQSVYQSIAPAI